MTRFVVLVALPVLMTPVGPFICIVLVYTKESGTWLVGLCRRCVRLGWITSSALDAMYQCRKVATAIGSTRAALSKIENDEMFLSRPVLAKLCEYYKLQPGDLLKYEERRARRPVVHQNLASQPG